MSEPTGNKAAKRGPGKIVTRPHFVRMSVAANPALFEQMVDAAKRLELPSVNEAWLIAAKQWLASPNAGYPSPAPAAQTQ